MQPEDLEAIADVVAQSIQEALAPLLVEFGEVRAQLALHAADLATTKAGVAPVAELVTARAVLETRVAAIETRPDSPRPAELELLKALADVRVAQAVLETRAPVPGPPGINGTNGTNGADGAPGTNGVDGLGFDDLAVEFDGDRTLALTFTRGAVTKTWPITLPFQRYQGVYQEGKAYAVGDTVTWASQLWHCNEATITPPGDASKLWQLCVRKGRDGRDGKDAPGGRV